MKKAKELSELLEQALAALDARDWLAAEELVMQIVVQDPEYPGAQELLDKVRKLRSAEIDYMFGWGYFKKEKWPQAIERLEAATQGDPDNSDARTRLEEAKRQAEIDRLLNEADQYRQKSEWGSVVRVLKSALALANDSEEIKQQLDDAEVELLYYAGEKHFKEGRWRVALVYFTKLKERRPGHDDASLKLREIEKKLRLEEVYRQAWEYEQACEWSKAVELYDQIYRDYPNYRDVVHRLAHCRDNVGKQEKGENRGADEVGASQRPGNTQTVEIPSQAEAVLRGPLVKLLQLLQTRFDEVELRTFCVRLAVDYESLPGKGKAGKAKELVGYLERRNRITELVEIGKQSRPDIAWPDIPSKAKGVRSASDRAPSERLERPNAHLAGGGIMESDILREILVTGVISAVISAIVAKLVDEYLFALRLVQLALLMLGVVFIGFAIWVIVRYLRKSAG